MYGDVKNTDFATQICSSIYIDKLEYFTFAEKKLTKTY